MADAEEERHRRGLRFRKREDHAVELFTEAREHLDDRARVDRVLVQLGRFYNPTLDQPIVDVVTRRGVLEALEAGDVESARRLLDERLALYTGTEPPRS
ncbi:MAG: hypothetical protein HY294_03250 [Candidatus Rokubacteria bacterium]|nr:hypothetical protein [Candidatus Rokubacteria bacterium]MBI3824991.1 hypothetical protein [Candidatus Rokubacteria bacterium]